MLGPAMQIPAHLRPPPWLWLVVFLLAAAATLVGAAVLARDIALRITEELVRERVALYGTYLEGELDKLKLLSALSCGNPDIVALLKDPADKLLRARVNADLAQANQTADTSRIYVVDYQVKIVAASDAALDTSVIGESRADKIHWLEAVSAATAFFVSFSPGDNELSYYAACAVSEDGRRLGTVFVRAQVQKFARAWSDLPHEQLRLLVADRHGVVFLASEPRWLWHTLAPLSPQQQAELRRTQRYRREVLPPLSWHALQRTPLGSSIGTIPTAADSDTPYLFHREILRDARWTLIVASDLNRMRRWVIAAVVIAIGALALVALLTNYFRQRRRYVTQLFETSIRDPLTKLFTRLYMTDAVTALEALQDRGEGVQVALAMFDLDHFKNVNDTYGHRCGDAVLRETGKIVLEESRDSDIPVRYGGEEIAVFLSAHSLQEATNFAERVLQRMRERRHFEKWSLQVTLSAGVALRRPFESLPHLIERADRHLYEAKRAGRNRVIAGENGVASQT